VIGLSRGSRIGIGGVWRETTREYANLGFRSSAGSSHLNLGEVVLAVPFLYVPGGLLSSSSSYS
jgi:hypothetical protein